MLCPVVYMHVYTAHIFIVCNSVICTNSFNVLGILYNGHIALKYTGHFVYSPLNSYLIYIGYWTLIILLLLTVMYYNFYSSQHN